MTHDIDSTALAEAMEQVIEHGMDELSRAMTILFNEALKIERLRALLPAGSLTTPAFNADTAGSYLSDHDCRFLGAQCRACILEPSDFGLPIPGLTNRLLY
jgi:hypothetical protein